MADASGEEDMAVDSSEPELELLLLVSEGKGKGKKEPSSRIQKKCVKGSGNAVPRTREKGRCRVERVAPRTIAGSMAPPGLALYSRRMRMMWWWMYSEVQNHCNV